MRERCGLIVHRHQANRRAGVGALRVTREGKWTALQRWQVQQPLKAEQVFITGDGEKRAFQAEAVAQTKAESAGLSQARGCSLGSQRRVLLAKLGSPVELDQPQASHHPPSSVSSGKANWLNIC